MCGRPRCRWALFALAALLTAPGQAGAALDRSFSGDGIARVAAFPYATTSSGTAIAVQPDGKILVGGYATYPDTTDDHFATGDDFAIARFLPSGALDPTFGDNGLVSTTIGLGPDQIEALGIQPNGRIVGVGYESQASQGIDVAVARWLSNGQPDSTFDDDGRAVIPVAAGNGADRAAGVAFQPGGKILIGGTVEDGADTDLFLLRLEANGKLDSGGGSDPVPTDEFRENGVGRSDPGGDNGLYDMLQQPDGKLILASEVQGTSNDNIPLLLRFNTDGTIDNGAGADLTPGDSFGTGGIVQVDFDLVANANDFPTGLALAPGGKVVMSAAAPKSGEQYQWAAARLTPAGALDSSGPGAFGGDGKVTFPMGTGSAGYGTLATDVAVQPDGKVVLGGYGYRPTLGDSFAAVRLRPGGSFDPTFGGDGAVFADIAPGGFDAAQSIALSGGRVFLAGSASPPTSSQRDLTLAALAQFDVDDDGRRDGVDNCPGKVNPAQLDKDKDGRGDACDPVDNGVPTAGDDTLIGTPAADKLNGLAGNDTIKGLGSADTLIGATGKDTLVGGAGGDTLRGGKGKDVFKGGKGNDRIRAADGTKELVACGKGNDDRAIVDEKDEPKDCETVTVK